MENEDTKAGMRVQIAQDVLKALETQRIKAAYGGYMRGSHPKLMALVDASDSTDPSLFQELGQAEYTAPQTCSVCAIGAVFVAAVDRHDSLKLSTVYSASYEEEGRVTDSAMMPYLSQWFEEDQLRLMECAFEGSYQGRGGNEEEPSEDELEAAEEFYGEYEDVTLLITAIMENVIKNKGTFEP